MDSHITLRHMDGTIFNVPNQPFDAVELTAGIITAKRPLPGNRNGRRTTMLTVAVARPRVDDSPILDMVSVQVNTAPEIISQMLADARAAQINLDLTAYQVFQVGGPLYHNYRVPARRGRSLTRTQANKELAALGLA